MPDKEAIACELNNHANALRADFKYAAALSSYKRALALVPNDSCLECNIGATLWDLGEYKEAVKFLKKAIKHDPNNKLAHTNMGSALSSLRSYQDAEDCFNKALAIDDGYIPGRIYRGFSRLDQGDYAGGLNDYEARRPFRGNECYPPMPCPDWNGEDLNGKTLFIHSEQGIGDTILLSRFIAIVKQRWPDASIKFLTDGQLTNLLYEYRYAVEFMHQGVPWDSLGHLDYGVFLGSLPRILGCRADAIPNDPGVILARVEHQHMMHAFGLPAPELEPTVKVGICWTGNPKQSRNRDRSVPIEMLLPLAEHPNVILYSLQVGSDDLRRTGADSLVCDLSEELKLKGLVGAGNAMLEMDAVVTVCTSMAHLAGVLGVKCYTMLTYDPYWVWGRDGDTTPWYPGMKLIRQNKPNDWSPVIDRVKREIFSLADQALGS